MISVFESKMEAQFFLKVGRSGLIQKISSYDNEFD